MPTSRSKLRSERFRYGWISLLIGALLTVLIVANAAHERRVGNTQIADDSLWMLWSPAIFAVAGVVFIARGLALENSLKHLPTFRRPRRPQLFKPRPKADPPSERGRRRQAKPAAARAETAEAEATEAASRSSPPPAAAPEAREIPLDDRYRQACAELGVEPGTDWMVIRAIWRRKLQSWHPDQGGDHEVWLRKTAAYTLLEAWEQFKA
ncbi:hypothetical protein [Cyanobium sp. ATX 6F1]|uniref:hypothetical protein n=1 Tax=Cyanobium sp. ATX 6F1 TaxID=2823702 RepID=UPI0020CB7370|nr:hypothetical protein [Cyanobium sp. ATX 6F1]MCP9916003.1 hypothetical protein [Cyanobium sp. ATX 6F1]